MKTVSILLPSRQRPMGLVRTIESVRSTAGKGWDDCEIVLRIDSDDTPTVELSKRLQELYGTQLKVLVGNRGAGYGDLFRFYTEAAQLAEGYYAFFLNDDITLEGPGMAMVAAGSRPVRSYQIDVGSNTGTSLSPTRLT